MSQLYLLRTKGHLSAGEVEKLVYILKAKSQDDVKRILPHIIDMSAYVKFNITELTRIKPNVHLVERHLLTQEKEMVNGEVDEQMKIDDKKELPTLQKKNKNIFAFGLIGYISAWDEKNAINKISRFLLQKAINKNIDLPFVSNGHYIIDELGEVDNTKRADLSKCDPLEFKSGRLIVGGGACSPR